MVPGSNVIVKKHENASNVVFGGDEIDYETTTASQLQMASNFSIVPQKKKNHIEKDSIQFHDNTPK